MEGDEKAEKKVKVLLIGHSWGNGITDYGKYKFGKHKIDMDSDCKDGRKLSDGLSALKKKGEGYDAVVILLGINDYESDLKTLKDKFSKIIDEAKKHGRHVYICNVPQYDKATKEQNQKLADLNRWLKKQETGTVHIIDIAAEYSGPLHPESYSGVRKKILKEIKKQFSSVVASLLKTIPTKMGPELAQKQLSYS
ncbi:MAG: hypothetical protein N3E51_01700 [Candidatus Micrarchaeota archaeon]|nr:hypothetical protein [Candidatus Micrarchaeota archaeon]